MRTARWGPGASFTHTLSSKDMSTSHSTPGARGVALVTGGGRRIGRSISLELAAQGYDVAVHYLSSGEEAEEVAGIVRSLGRRALAIKCDLQDSAAMLALVPSVAQALGTVTCLVNNASVFENDALFEMTPGGYDRHLEINLKAPVFLARATALGLPEGTGGNVINITDQRVWKPTPDFFTYTLSKSGLWSATRMLAQALAPAVRVNAVGPGPVLQSVHQSPDAFLDEQRGTLLKRGASPEEIARAVAFILATPSMTGQMIALDGGQHLVW